MQVAFNIIQELGQVDLILFERFADPTDYNFYLSPSSDNVQKIGMFYLKDLELVSTPVEILMAYKHSLT